MFYLENIYLKMYNTLVKTSLLLVLTVVFQVIAPIFTYGQKDSTTLKLESLVNTLIAQDQFNGAILYAKGDKILYEKYHGWQNAFEKEPLTPTSSFNLASVSKQFFGAALLLLHEDGKIDLDAPLKKYFPDFPNEVLTVRQLVTQTSGLKEYFDEAIQSYSTNYIVENEDVYATMMKLDTLFNFPPGDAYEYSNTNYIFLALLIEKVAGMPVEQFLDKRIFQPLQLDNTFAYHLKRKVSPPNRVIGMEKSNTQMYRNDLTPLDGVIGDGNLYSTPRDLMKWLLALDANQLLSPANQQMAWQPQKLNNDSLSYYGFGWRIDKETGHYVHTGGWVGFLNIIRFDPKTKSLLVVLNSDGNYGSIVYGQRIFLNRDYALPDYQLINNVQVVDGTGLPAYPADVRLRNNRVFEIGDLTAYPNEPVVDGNGKILCPGFIDSHSHHDRYYLKDDNVLPAISQGITTIITGQDGGSHLPLDTFFTQIKAQPATVNIGSYVGHNSLRLEVMGRENFKRTATKAEVEKMAVLLERELKSGALGMSSGLEYDPGIYSNTKELLYLAKVLSKNNSRYMSHIRSEDRQLELAIQEIIDIGKTADIPVHIAHFKIAMSGKWGKAREIIAWLQEARSEGVNITADIYPYPYWLSTLQVLMPERDFDNYESAKYALTAITPPESLLLSNYEANPSYIGKTIQEIAKEKNEDPVKTYMGLIAESIEKNTGETVIGTSMTELDIQQLMAWSYTNICSDGEGLSLHPRGFGAFPRVLAKYVREQQLLTLEEAIRKMTSLTAENVGITDRGLIAKGYYADMVLLDPEMVQDKATVKNPHELSDGILKVWVNGQLAFEEGKVTEARAGQVIRKE